MKKQEQEWEGLRRRVIEMGNLAEAMVGVAVEAITSSEVDSLIKKVLQQEEQLDKMQLAVDKEAIRLLTVYSPVAADLRFIMTVSRITGELERVGDHATNLCESIQLMTAKTHVTPSENLQKMGSLVSTMMHDALDAFARNDMLAARSTIAQDDMIDAINDQVLEELLSDQLVREVLSGTKDIAGSLAQLLIARSLERIGDQATNISEEVVYMVKGDDIRHRTDESSNG
ncbi:MAG: phosphate signaling complex protein PhoU [Planctomycetales bacterium]|nr:phosphate signaling complex protein PhoU [Planctomycetales bacterium]